LERFLCAFYAFFVIFAVCHLLFCFLQGSVLRLSCLVAWLFGCNDHQQYSQSTKSQDNKTTRQQIRLKDSTKLTETSMDKNIIIYFSFIFIH